MKDLFGNEHHLFAQGRVAMPSIFKHAPYITYIGTTGNDTISAPLPSTVTPVGTFTTNVIFGLGGNNTITSVGGNNWIYSGDFTTTFTLGNDKITIGSS